MSHMDSVLILGKEEVSQVLCGSVLRSLFRRVEFLNFLVLFKTKGKTNKQKKTIDTLISPASKIVCFISYSFQFTGFAKFCKLFVFLAFVFFTA